MAFKTTRTDIKNIIAQINERGALCSPPLKKFEEIRFQGRGYQLCLIDANGWHKFPKDDVTCRPAREFYAMLVGMLAMIPPAGK